MRVVENSFQVEKNVKIDIFSDITTRKQVQIYLACFIAHQFLHSSSTELFE